MIQECQLIDPDIKYVINLAVIFVLSFCVMLFFLEILVAFNTCEAYASSFEIHKRL
jgi:hypothetical protein